MAETANTPGPRGAAGRARVAGYEWRAHPVGLPLVVLAGVFLMLCGCGRPGEELAIDVIREGDVVTFNWDGRAVHEVFVVEMDDAGGGTGVWEVSYTEERPQPPGEPTILPPLPYGEPVANSFSSEARPLVRGSTYRVDVDVLGRGQTCRDHGIDVEEQDEEEPGWHCSIASGSVKFTY